MQEAEVQVVVTDGEIGEDVKQRARRKIAGLERYAPGDFLFAEVRFTQHPSEAQPTFAHAFLDVQGELVQARMRADRPTECLDLLEKRLQKTLRRLNERLQTRRHEPEFTEEGEWRRGAMPTPRPDHFPRPHDERQLIERVTHAREPSTPEEAAFDLEMLEDDWLLYVDEATDTDAVIRRLDGDASFGVAVVGGAARVNRDGPYSIELEAAPSDLTVDAAVERLRHGDEGHVFFVDVETARGAVAYWRYDGHYGLVRPREV